MSRRYAAQYAPTGTGPQTEPTDALTPYTRRKAHPVIGGRALECSECWRERVAERLEQWRRSIEGQDATEHLCDNESAPGRATNATRGLTRSTSTQPKEGLAMKATCSIEECTKDAVTRGWCPAHYQRWRTTGDPLGSKPRVYIDRKVPVAERFWPKVDVRGPDECWPWLAYLDKGHGRFIVMGDDGRGHPIGAHRMAYQLAVGQIPEGMHIDHTCHTNDAGCREAKNCQHRRCCNPKHLEPVTPDENRWRGRWAPTENAKRTHCQRGHEFTDENTYFPARGGRQCRECMRMRDRRRRSTKVPDNAR